MRMETMFGAHMIVVSDPCVGVLEKRNVITHRMYGIHFMRVYVRQHYAKPKREFH